jgi:hypothetical protein
MTDMTEPTRQLLDLCLGSRCRSSTHRWPASLVARWRSGVHRYAGFIHGLAVRTLVDQQVAEDITQEVFVSRWEHPERIEPGPGTTAFRAGTCRCMTISPPS